jgi:cytochrome c biogenesis protein CcmG, thiol:disulfide interchange protein DsbE
LAAVVKRLLSPVPMVALAGVLALVALLAYGLSTKQPDTSIDSQIAAGNRPLPPEVTFAQLDADKQWSLADYRGKVVVLNFWASWCGPCKEEAPLLERWHRKLEDKGVTVVGVDVLDVTSDASRFIADHKLSYPQWRDPDGSKLKGFDVVGYPETVVIDRDGRIAATARGPVDDKFFTEEVMPVVEERS